MPQFPSTFRRRSSLLATTLSVGVCSALMISAYGAQTPPAAAAAPPATAPAAPAVPVVDATAKTILQQAFAAQQALTAYSANVKLDIQQGTKTQAADGTIAYQKPGKARVTFHSDTPVLTRTTITDGTSIFLTASDTPKEYQKQPSAGGANGIPQAIAAGGISATRLLPGIISGSSVDRLLPPGTALSHEADETIDGVVNDVVKIVAPGPSGEGGGPILSLAIGKDDHLIRRIVIEAKSPDGGNGVKLVEEYTSVKANPTLAANLFTFVPPAGVKMAAVPQEAPSYDARLKKGSNPLPFAGKDLAGKPVTLDQYKGKVVLVDFWATWCPPCREEIPNVVAAYNKYRVKGFDVVGVSLDRATDRAQLVAYTKDHKMPWRQIYDGKYWEADLAKKYGVQAIPFSLLIGKDGKIVAVNPRGPELEPAVKAALAK